MLKSPFNTPHPTQTLVLSFCPKGNRCQQSGVVLRPTENTNKQRCSVQDFSTGDSTLGIFSCNLHFSLNDKSWKLIHVGTYANHSIIFQNTHTIIPCSMAKTSMFLRLFIIRSRPTFSTLFPSGPPYHLHGNYTQTREPTCSFLQGRGGISAKSCLHHQLPVGRHHTSFTCPLHRALTTSAGHLFPLSLLSSELCRSMSTDQGYSRCSTNFCF